MTKVDIEVRYTEFNLSELSFFYLVCLTIFDMLLASGLANYILPKVFPIFLSVTQIGKNSPRQPWLV